MSCTSTATSSAAGWTPVPSRRTWPAGRGVAGSRKMGFSTSSVSRCSMAATIFLASGRPSAPRRATSNSPGWSGSQNVANSGLTIALMAVARGFFLIVCPRFRSAPILLPVRPGRKRRPILVPPGGASVRGGRRPFRGVGRSRQSQTGAVVPYARGILRLQPVTFFHWCEPPMGASLSVPQALISPEWRNVFSSDPGVAPRPHAVPSWPGLLPAPQFLDQGPDPPLPQPPGSLNFAEAGDVVRHPEQQRGLPLDWHESRPAQSSTA